MQELVSRRDENVSYTERLDDGELSNSVRRIRRIIPQPMIYNLPITSAVSFLIELVCLILAVRSLGLTLQMDVATGKK